MSDMMENKLDAEELDAVSGGTDSGLYEIEVIPIEPYWIKVTASLLNCRNIPSLKGGIIKKYEYGHKLKVNGITSDGKWYRLLVNDPHGGMIYGFIFKAFTEEL